MPDEFDQYLEPSSGSDLAAKHAVLYEKGIDPASDPNAKAEMMSLFSKNPKAQEEYINYLNNAQVGGKETDEFAQYIENPSPRPVIQRPQQPFTQGLGNIPIGGGDIPIGLDVGPYSQSLNQLAQPAAIDDAVRAITTGITGTALSGLAGLVGLVPIAGGGLDRAKEWQESVAGATIHQPYTLGGQQWTQAANAPMMPFQKAAETLGGGLESLGAPWWVSAGVHSAIEAAPVLYGAKKLKTSVGKTTAPVIDGELAATIEYGLQKSIGPKVLRSPAQHKAYLEKGKNAVIKIIENNPDKPLPASLKEFENVLDPTQRSILSKYTEMAAETGEQGLMIKPVQAVKELRDFANRANIKDMHPDLAKYALEQADAIEARIKNGGYNPLEIQDEVAIRNAGLESYYSNPKYDMSGRVPIDAAIKNHFAKALDDGIEGYGKPGYQALKNDWGSIQTIKRDVTRAAMRDARKTDVGLYDFLGNIYSGAEILRGITNISSPNILTGVGIKGLQKVMNYIRNPNRIVKNMFADTQKLLNKREPIGWRGGELEASSAGSPLLSQITGYPIEQSVINPNLQKSPITGEVLGLDKSLKSFRPPKVRATLVPKPLVQAARPQTLRTEVQLGESPLIVETKQQIIKRLEESEKSTTMDRVFEAALKRGAALKFDKIGSLKAKKPMTVEEHMKQLKMRKE